MTLIAKKDIIHHIPQREPFVMLDRLVAASGDTIQSDFKIDASNLFVTDGYFTVYGMIENIAQTCVAGIPFIASPGSTPPKDGYIGAVSGLKLYGLAAVQTTLKTTATVEYR